MEDMLFFEAGAVNGRICINLQGILKALSRS
jgi:hypothetical protein